MRGLRNHAVGMAFLDDIKVNIIYNLDKFIDINKKIDI